MYMTACNNSVSLVKNTKSFHCLQASSIFQVSTSSLHKLFYQPLSPDPSQNSGVFMSHKMICKLPHDQLALHCIAILILINPFAARLNIMMSKLEPISSINPFLMLGYPPHKTLATMCYMSSCYPLAIFTCTLAIS